MPPRTPTVPQEDVIISPLMGNQRLADLYFGDQQKPWGGGGGVRIEHGDFAEPRIRTRCLTAGLIRLDVNLRLSQEIPGVPAGSRDVS